MGEFWMVWSLQGSSPTHRHMTEPEARAEAERLARINTGREFYVLHAVAVCKKTDVAWTQLDQHIPF